MTKFLPLSLALAASTVLFAGAAVFAQPAPEPRVMTRAEAETRAAQAFARLDVNQDGTLNPADREANMRQRFDTADSDRNGQLSFEEAGAMQEARRDQRAERREGRAERREGRAERAAPGMGMGRGSHQMPGGGMRGMRGPGRMGGPMLEGADADKNGEVSQAEFTGAALARFDRADANNDGTITREERRGGFRAHPMRRG